MKGQYSAGNYDGTKHEKTASEKRLNILSII